MPPLPSLKLCDKNSLSHPRPLFLKSVGLWSGEPIEFEFGGVLTRVEAGLIQYSEAN
jgi:hypothetical protein